MSELTPPVPYVTLRPCVLADDGDSSRQQYPAIRRIPTVATETPIEDKRQSSMPKLDASSVPTTEIAVLEDAYDRLPEGSLRTTLESLSRALRGGQDTFVVSEGEDFTPSEAAKLLGVSRTHLYKILDSGALPHRVVGARDRRIAAPDLMAYRARMLAMQKRHAEAAAHTDDLEDASLDEFD